MYICFFLKKAGIIIHIKEEIIIWYNNVILQVFWKLWRQKTPWYFDSEATWCYSWGGKEWTKRHWIFSVFENCSVNRKKERNLSSSNLRAKLIRYTQWQKITDPNKGLVLLWETKIALFDWWLKCKTHRKRYCRLFSSVLNASETKKTR